MDTMANIKLFVCCHQRCEVPEHPLLIPIQVGAALTKERFSGFLTDNTGENISEKNRSYCELTAQFWAWKNVSADYYGFFHYRRYLYPDMNAHFPYRIERAPNIQLLSRLGYGSFSDWIEQYDLIAPIGENMYISVREHYQNALFHHGKDLEELEGIIKRKFADYVEPMQRYFSGTVLYFANMFIMQKAVFEDYCQWLFSILAEFDQLADTSQYDAQEKRVDGYLAERLFGVYYTAHKNHLKTIELPRVHFDAMTGKPDLKNRGLYLVCPPGTRRRALVKRLCK